MKQTASCPLRLPISRKNAVAEVSREEGTSINQFMSVALAEKLAAFRTERFPSERRTGADADAAQRIVFREGDDLRFRKTGFRWPASPARMLRVLPSEAARADPS